MMADLQKHQNQGTTEQHPGDLEKNVVKTSYLKRQRPKGHLQEPLFTPGVGRERQTKRGLGRAHRQDCYGQERLLGKDSKELLKHSLLCRGWCRLPDRKLRVGGEGRSV